VIKMSSPVGPRPKKAEQTGFSATEAAGACIGRVVSFEAGQVCVEFEGNMRGPLVARVSAAIDDVALAEAAREKQDVVLLFEGGSPTRPLLVGVLRSATPLVDASLAGPLPQGEKVARVDGRRVVIEGHEEVVLRCGKASLTLQRNGRVVLRGVNVISQAEEVQKIRGGKVQIN
jgi:hypothetical protein